MITQKILNKRDTIILYGITPPKTGTPEEKIKEIVNKLKIRLKNSKIDGLILYDLQDEAARTSEKRVFPFIETLDGYEYCRNYLSDLQTDKIIYRSVGKYSQEDLTKFLRNIDTDNYLSVFVGAASKEQKVLQSLKDAYQLKRKVNKNLIIGGVTIPERHLHKHDEHLRLFNKIRNGCSFFVSQGVYDVDASLNLLSDYYCYGKQNNLSLVPIIFTFTPCGSAKTLQFMKWLGISVPKWLENELLLTNDMLVKSIDLAEQNWKTIKQFADEKEIPIGCNIESISIRKAEIEASIELLKRITSI